MTTYALTAIFILNALWFGAAFRYFALTPVTAAKILVPKTEREPMLMATVAASVRFLGGMNFALAVLAVLILLNLQRFPGADQRALLALVFCVAHASQFVGNLAVLLGGQRAGQPLWPATSGPMLFIFVVDFSLMVANGVLAAVLVWG